MKILTAPEKFEQADDINKGIEKRTRVNEVIRFVKSYFHSDVKDLHRHHGKAEVRLHLRSMPGIIVIGMPSEEQPKPKKNGQK